MDGVDGVDVAEGGDRVSVRHRKRDSLFMTAQLITGAGEPVEVRVRNLSEGGLMIEHNRAIAPGSLVTLHMRGLGELVGTVAWCTHGRAGIALDQPIDPKRARQRVSGGGGRTIPAHVKPALVARAPRR